MKNSQCYEILGIQPLPDKADNLKQITRAYRRLALERHPDRKGGTNEAFNALNEAYCQLMEYHNQLPSFDPAPTSATAKVPVITAPTLGVSYIVVNGRPPYPDFRQSYAMANSILTGMNPEGVTGDSYRHQAKVVNSRDAINNYFSDAATNPMRQTALQELVPHVVIEVNLPNEKVSELLKIIRDVSAKPEAVKAAHDLLTRHANFAIFSHRTSDVCDQSARFDNIVEAMLSKSNDYEKKDMLLNAVNAACETGMYPNHIELSIRELRAIDPGLFPLPKQPEKPTQSKEGFFARVKKTLGVGGAPSAPSLEESPAAVAAQLRVMKNALLTSPPLRPGRETNAVDVFKAFQALAAAAGPQLAGLAPELDKTIQAACKEELHLAREGRRKLDDRAKRVYETVYTHLEKQFNALVENQTTKEHEHLLTSVKQSLDACKDVIDRVPEAYKMSDASSHIASLKAAAESRPALRH